VVKLKVLMLTPEFLPVHGGVGNYVLEIARNFQDDVYVHIVTPRCDSVLAEHTDGISDSVKDLPPNIKVTYLGTASDSFFKNLSFQLICSKYVPEIARKENVDIVHSQSSMPDYLISPSKLRIPIVTTMHTTVEGHSVALREAASSSTQLTTSEKLVLLLGPVLGRFEARYYTNQRYYITVSRWAKQVMIDSQGIEPSRIRVINICADYSRFSPSRVEEARVRFPELAEVAAPKVLYLSRMATRKGMNVLLRAIPRVLSRTDAHFIFAGAGKKPEFAIPQRNFTFLGHVAGDVPPFLYALSDIFVLPSLYENFPACILEAMASQCAVVSTCVGGIPEMIEDGADGVLIHPNDSEALADSLTRLAEDKTLRADMGRKARESVIRRYNWKEASRRTLEFYEEVVAQHKLKTSERGG
jgi:glycosyltransferase involved in cell wall biosynthesis